jgi:host factor-I protein
LDASPGTQAYGIANACPDEYTTWGIFVIGSGRSRGQQSSLKEIGMESKPAQNIQDSFLNTARKEKSIITVYLLSGVKLTGRIRSFDKYSVVLETNNQEQLIFKHAISTVVMGRISHGHSERVAPVSSPTPVADAAEPSSGTEG